MGRRLGILMGAALLLAALWYAYSEGTAETTSRTASGETATASGDGEPASAREGFSLWGLLSGAEGGRGQAQGGWIIRPSWGRGSRGGFSIGPECWLSGRVTDEKGQPLADIDVQGMDSGGRPLVRVFQEARTDADGRYRLGPFPSGLYDVTAHGEGYVGTTIPAHPIASDSETLDFTLRDSVPVEGTVVDEAGQPVAKVSLFLHRPQEQAREKQRPITFAESREDGTFHLDAPDAGEYVVRMMQTGFLDTERTVMAPARGARLVLRSGAAVEAEVVDEAGRPVKEAEVHVLPEVIQGSYRDRSGTTDETGKVLVTGLGPDRYRVVAAMPESNPLRTVRQLVELRDSERRKVRLQFEEGLRLSGVVVDPAGKPVAEAEVRVAPAFLMDSRKYEDPDLEPYSEQLDAAWSSSKEQTNRTGPDGRFTVYHLRPGPYLVTALKDGYAFDSRATGGTRRTIGPISGVMVSAGTSDVRLVLESLGYVRGRVVGPDGTPIPLFQLNGLIQEDARGEFRWPIHGNGELVLAFAARGLAGTVRKVQGREGKDVELGDVVLGHGRRVRVRVVDAATSEPVPTAIVDVRDMSDSDPDSGRSVLYGISEAHTASDGTRAYEASPPLQSDAEGTLVLEHVEERPLLLHTKHPHYLETSVPLGAKSSEVTVRLPAGAWVQGEVRAEGAPVEHGTVRLLTLEGVWTDSATLEEGAYSLGPVEAGRYVVQVDVYSYQEEGPEPVFLPRQVQVPASGTVTLDLEAQRMGTEVEVLASEEVDEVILVPGEQPLPGPGEPPYKTFAFGHRARVNGEGPFRFRMLPAGHYTLFAVRDWEALELDLHREEVEVPAREKMSIPLKPRWQRHTGPPSE